MTGKGDANASVRMAVATLLARVTGYGRSVLLVAALGNGLHADLFSIANTIPNMLVVLLGAGVFNAVLVPQLVRADRDGDGPCYVNQVITLFGAVLLVATAAVTCAAPVVLRAFVSSGLGRPELADQYRSAVALAYCCLPQIFFYGVYALLGQIMNSRRVFGPMMWTPILNNAVSVGVLSAYLVLFGPAADRCSGYTTREVVLLGLGTTAGVVAQTAGLLPFLHRAGIRYRPTLRWWGPRMRTTLALGSWTLAVVLTNQVVYGVIVRLASGGTATGDACSVDPGAAGTGYTIYSSACLLIMAPHAVVSVSLMTARLPRLAELAADGELIELGHQAAVALRLLMCVIIPVAALLCSLSPELSDLVWGYGSGAGSSLLFAPTLACFAVALVFFTAHYVALRGLYALGDNRVVLGIQVVVGMVNLLAALVLVGLADRERTAPALATAYCLAYLAGSVTSWAVLGRRLGAHEHRRSVVAVARIGLGAGAAAAGGLATVRVVSGRWWAAPATKAEALLTATAATAVFVTIFLAGLRALRVREARMIRDRLIARRGAPV